MIKIISLKYNNMVLLDDDDHRIRKEVQDMDIVTFEKYNYLHEYGHSYRLYVQFNEEIDELPETFTEWMKENKLVILSAGINNLDADGALCIELQTIEGMVDYL